MQIKFLNAKRKLKDLVPLDYNPRKISEKEKEQLKKSLEKFGLAEVPVINKNNNILAGHQRIAILVALYGKKEEIDVRVPNRLLTVKEEKEYNIRSNKNTGSWDFKDDFLLNFEKEDLLEWGFEDFELPSSSVDIDELTDSDFEQKEKAPKTCPHCGGEL